MRAPALAITQLSPVATAAVFCRLGGALWATVVVKATFQLVHGESARLIAAEELVGADRPGPHGGSLERARETAPHLPNAGVLLSGHACAPGGRAVPSMSVRLGVSRDRPLVDKTLHVFGSRAAGSPGAVTPFQRMPIVYERTFGGAGVAENPAGTGGAGSASLPNIVDPRDARRPAGFGPIAASFAPRRALPGGLTPEALAAPVLEAPQGFDWRFFQAAPADQQIDRLRGDEWIVLDGMSPSLPRVQSRLPQVMALARRQAAEGGAVAEQPIDLRADMLVIDADRLTASVIWRGRFPVASVEALGAIRVLTGLEWPGAPVQWPVTRQVTAAGVPARGSPPAPAPGTPLSTGTQEVSLAAILGAKVPFAPAREGPAVPSPAPAPETPLSTGTQEVSLAAILGKKVPFSTAREGPPAESLATAGAPKRTPMSTGTTDVNVAELLKGAALRLGAPDAPAPVGPPVPASVAGAPPAVPASVSGHVGGPPVALASVPAPVGPPAVPVRLPAAAPVEAPPLMVAPSLVAAPSLVEVPSPMDTSPSVAPSLPGSKPVRPAAPSPAALARKRVVSLLEGGRSFNEEDLAGANLSGLDLCGASFVRCDLRGAKLRGAKLIGAVLTGAILDDADLRGAVLEEADLCDASLVRADLERARLAGCNGAGAVLREASLAGADLRGARFPGASFEAASLRDAQADGADLTGARLDRADLSASSFRDARLAAAVLAFATLDGADLQRAVLVGANLHQASRRMTRLAGADLTGTIEEPPEPAPGARER